MASDLSELIQNGLNSTLESLLAKTTNIEKLTKAHPDDLKNQCVRVNTVFEFDNITSNWSFFIPAFGASHIFNLMMGEDIEPSNEVDDDTVDALNEVVSNICGGLSTAINGSDFEDLGGVKFSLNGNEIVDGSEYASTENLFKFTISLEEKEIEFFIAFDEPIMEYIETIASSPEAEAPLEDEVTEEEEETETEDTPEENDSVSEDEESTSDAVDDTEPEQTEDTPEEEDDSESKDEESTNDAVDDAKPEENEISSEDATSTKTEETPEKVSKLAFLKNISFFKIDETLSDEEKKQAKLKKIIIIVAGLFGLVILTGIILFLTGAFDPEEETEISKEQNTTIQNNTSAEKVAKKLVIKSKPKKKEINFKLSQINITRLNKKLSLLTKYEILEEDAIEKIKVREKERLYKEKQKRLEEFASNNKEEALFTKVIDNATKDNKHKSKYKTNGINKDTNISTNDNNSTLPNQPKVVTDKFIQIPTLQLKHFQSFIKRAKQNNADLAICKDLNGRTQIFIGPFFSDKSRDKLLKTLHKHLLDSTKKLDLTKKEFNDQCSF